jgi:hypothetical protein
MSREQRTVTEPLPERRAQRCPTCNRVVGLAPQLDGFGRPMADKPFRFHIHAGTRWGRQCPNSGELYR